MATQNIETHIRVFMSYSHDTPKHEDEVRKLVARLKKDGFEVHNDQYELPPKQGWIKWTLEEIKKATFVLVACTERYKYLSDNPSERNTETNSIRETSIISESIYKATDPLKARHNNEIIIMQNVRDKFLPIVFQEEDTTHIPQFQQGAEVYLVDTEEGYQKLFFDLLRFKAHILLLESKIARNLKSWKESFAKLEAASELFWKIDYPLGKGLSALGYGDNYGDMKQFETAKKHLFDAEKIFTEMDKKDAIAKIHMRLGAMEFYLQEYNEAYQHLVSASEAFCDLGDIDSAYNCEILIDALPRR